MSVSTVASTFTYIAPPTAARETAASARAAEAADNSTDAGQTTKNEWPPMLGSQKLEEQRNASAYGRLVAAQEEATSRPSVTARDASKAYSAATGG